MITNETNFCHKTERLFYDSIGSILVTGTDTDKIISFYQRGRTRKDQIYRDQTLVNMASAFERVATFQYIDCPYFPLVVRRDGQYAVILRRFMRDMGLLVVVEFEFDDAPEFIWVRDEREGLEVAVLDATARAEQLEFVTKIEARAFDGNMHCCHLVQYIRMLAQVLGCNVKVINNVSDNMCYDSLENTELTFVALLLLMLFLSNESEGRDIVFEIKHTGALPILQLRSRLRKGADINCSSEFEEYRRISGRFNMQFECYANEDNTVNIIICPSKAEWSGLGIKARTELEYDA